MNSLQGLREATELCLTCLLTHLVSLEVEGVKTRNDKRYAPVLATVA